MTPKEKAEELVGKFNSISQYGVLALTFENSKQCALIAVDEMLDRLTRIKFYSELNFIQEFKYWQEVKQEIERL